MIELPKSVIFTVFISIVGLVSLPVRVGCIATWLSVYQLAYEGIQPAPTPGAHFFINHRLALREAVDDDEVSRPLTLHHVLFQLFHYPVAVGDADGYLFAIKGRDRVAVDLFNSLPPNQIRPVDP